MFRRRGVAIALAMLLVVSLAGSNSSPEQGRPPTILDREKQQYESIQLNYDHVQTYSFQVSNVEDFIIAV